MSGNIRKILFTDICWEKFPDKIFITKRSLFKLTIFILVLTCLSVASHFFSPPLPNKGENTIHPFFLASWIALLFIILWKILNKAYLLLKNLPYIAVGQSGIVIHYFLGKYHSIEWFNVSHVKPWHRISMNILIFGMDFYWFDDSKRWRFSNESQGQRNVMQYYISKYKYVE